jgi:hypothetical protein
MGWNLSLCSAIFKVERSWFTKDTLLMAWFSRSLRFTVLAVAVALTLVLAVNLPTQVQAQLSPSLGDKLENAFRPPAPPGPGTPVNTQTGGTRGPCMTQRSKPLLALVPTSGVAETVSENPTVFWYTPEISAAEAKAPAIEFVLKDANDVELYSAEYALTKSATSIAGVPGIMSLTVAPLYPLEMGREYRWEVTLMCNSQDADNSENITDQGGFKRVALDPNLERLVRQATTEQRVGLYADRKLWYETLGALSQLRRDRPSDRNLADAWTRLLNAVGLSEISTEPLFQSARNVNN